MGLPALARLLCDGTLPRRASRRILTCKRRAAASGDAREVRTMAGKTKSNGGSKARPEPRQRDGVKRPLRSRLWFDNPDNPGMTALYIERYLNFGLTPAELRSGKPIIGIAQTGSDLSPCNRHHL